MNTVSNTGATGSISEALARHRAIECLKQSGDVHQRAPVRKMNPPQAQTLEQLGIEQIQGDLTRPK